MCPGKLRGQRFEVGARSNQLTTYVRKSHRPRTFAMCKHVRYDVAKNLLHALFTCIKHVCFQLNKG